LKGSPRDFWNKVVIPNGYLGNFLHQFKCSKY
jgi:hypothetical protein